MYSIFALLTKQSGSVTGFCY